MIDLVSIAPKLLTDIESYTNGGIQVIRIGSTNVIGWSSAAPTTGTWNRGDVIFNTSITTGASPGWICTASGSPGTWEQIVALSDVNNNTAAINQNAAAINENSAAINDINNKIRKSFLL